MRASHALKLLAIAAFTALAPLSAHADLHLCNRTSYVLDLALGLEMKGGAATRGWFRVLPGDCRPVLQGAVDAEAIFVHSRPHPVYGDSPLPLASHAELCISDSPFVIAGARRCPSAGQRLAPFTQVRPSESGADYIANIAEESEYSAEQSRLAGIQRLLVIADYDAEPIDGIEGRKTEAAIAKFIADRKLNAAVVETAAFFDALLEAAERAEAIALSWCNDTRHTVMAALGSEEKGGIVTRGWYRVSPGHCMRPATPGKPTRLFSFAEAVDEDGQAIRRGGKPLTWGGPVTLCTRDLQFEIAEQGACAAQGHAETGFAAVDTGQGRPAIIRFRE